ncbi:MAG: secretin N-terminal domain-containing protein [Luteolibacter sp.]|jgi:type II secretory pathway component GspD/PulD (secretin)|nr:secretin N-terminal domain-containing protein [Luteolibacter sp.]
MKAANLLNLSAALWLVGSLCAQTPANPLIEPVAEPTADLQAEIPAADTAHADLPPPANSPDLPLPSGAPAGEPATVVTPAPGAPFGPLAQQQQEMQKSDEGFIIKDAGLNDIFQFLAKSAGRQYFHNTKISGPDFLVTGHLNDGNPLQQMEELAFMYGLSLHIKGNTIYALTQAQLAQLPSAEFHYQLRYLRPTDMEQIKELIKPMLSPGTGIVNFEPKTNTIVIIDSAHRIEQARELLHGIDQAKGQIIVETKILRVNSGAAERVGVNWSSSLGETGTSLRVIRDLNSVFGLDSPILDSATSSTSNNLVLSPLELSGVLRALAEGGIARQISNPTLITEDNEQATISIIDRVPIITSTTTPGSAGSEPIVTEEVRYKIDTSDKSIDSDPEKHREIGISLVVTPTLLPDGTVRMKMRPRTAQIVPSKSVVSQTGNSYPFVTESMVEAIARVPDGHSLVVGGFYGEEENRDRSKIPLFGDIPVLNFFFKSKESVKEQASLVFVVTPKSYNPSSVGANRGASNRIRGATTLDCDHEWIDPENPGPAHEANLKRSVRGLQPVQAPYFPRGGELTGEAPPARVQSTQPRFSRARK